ncbi:helix-turn-helix domain-containing protein [Enterococcus faecium]|nr:helix-turn-helix domain-containing protein [Enterococcus faecium]
MSNFKNSLKTYQVNMPIHIVRDKRMNARTKGVLLILASHDDNWKFYVSQIADDCGLSKPTLQRELKTLEELGYLKRTLLRDEKGMITGYDWELLDPKAFGTPNQPNQQTSETEQTEQTELLPETNENKKKKQPKPRAVKKKYGRYQNVLFTDEELEKLKAEFPNTWEERIERVSIWADSKNLTRNGLATIRTWARKNNDYEQPKQEATDRDDWL